MARKDWPPILERAAAIVEEYDTAVTLRQVHYRLVAEAEATGSGYRTAENDYKNLSRLTAEAAATARSRRCSTAPARSSGRDLGLAGGGARTRSQLVPPRPARTQEVLPVVVVEKATLIAQVVSWFGGLCVPAVALRGYASETLERLVLELVEDDHRDVVLLYAGDFDPTGEDIPRAFEDNTGLDLRRVALTAEQVDEYGLPPAPGKASDSRAAGFVARHGRLVQVELEALDPDDLRALLTAELDGLIETSSSQVERERQQAETARLAELARTWED